MINFDVNIYLDPVYLLQAIPDVATEVFYAYEQTDYYSDRIVTDLKDMYEDDFDTMLEHSSLSFVDYINVLTDDVSYDFEETEESIRNVSFLIGCEFDDEQFISDLQREYETRCREDVEM